MRAWLIPVTVIALTNLSLAEGYVDPFVNPVYLKEKQLEKLQEIKKEQKKTPTQVKLFEPKLPKPLRSLSIQGTIESKGKRVLVVIDPETGETFFLREGDPVSPDTKIVKITQNKVILVKFYRLKGKLKKKTLTLNVDTEGLNNG
jgi:type II secretory pathway component PulC